jgi:hypothetical protein
MNITYYSKALYLLKEDFNKKKKYSGITIHTLDETHMKNILSMLSDVYQVNLSDIKINYEKTKYMKFDELYYFNTLNYENVDTTSFPYLKVCYDDEDVKIKILKFCNGPKVVNRSFWYPNRPDELTNDKKCYYYSPVTDTSKNKYPIYIISKGRANIKGTAKYLENIGLDYKLVIEPEEYDDYALHHPIDKILICPENFSERGQGGIPVRNFVWEHSISINAEKHWILDDNIHNYKRINQGKKIIIKSPLIFKIVEDYVDRFSNIKMSGHNYSFFVASSQSPHPVIKNTRVFSSILLSNDIYPKFAWRGRYNEDIDLSIRILKAGYATLLFNTLTANKATTMSTKGGNTDSIYSVEDAHLKKAEELQKAHPDVVEITTKYGRIHHNANLNSFKNNTFDLKDELFFSEDLIKDNSEYDLVLLEEN